MSSIQKPILLVYLMLHLFCSYSQTNTFFSDSIRARDLNFKGNELGKAGLHLQAQDTFFLGLDLRIELYGKEDYNLGAPYQGIGITYRHLGRYDLALKYFKLAEQNYQSDMQRFKYKTKTLLYSNIANVYRSKLDFNQALQYLYQTLSLNENSSESTPQDIAATNYKIAEIYYSINDYDRALNLINANIENAYLEETILYYELLAFIHHEKGNYKEARKSYQNALSLSIDSKEEDENIDIARQYLNYSLFLIRINEYEEANITQKKAYDIIKFIQHEKGRELADYYNLKGYYIYNVPIEEQSVASFSNQKRKNLLEAISWYEKALFALNFPTNYTPENTKNFSKWLSIIDCIDFLKKIADTNNKIAQNIQNKNSEEYIYYLSRAIGNYQTVSTIIQKARKELSSDESKIQLTALEQSTFHELIKTSYKVYSITKNPEFIDIAFQSSERTKSSSVFDKLSNETAMDNSLIPDSLVQRENNINNAFTIYSEKRYEENNKSKPDSSKINAYDSAILQINRDREELNLYLETNYSDYYELKYSEAMLSIADIQQKITEDDVIIEYVLNEQEDVSELYSFAIFKNEVIFKQQKINRDIIHALESMYYFMSNSNYLHTTNDESKDFCISSHSLYNVLIDPFYYEIQDKKLTIVPDGKLNYLAFDALLEELPDTNNPIRFNQLKYLIKNYNINYSYSSNLLFKLRLSGKKLRNKVIAFAPDYSNDSIVIGNQKYMLSPLPGVQKEVEQISKTVNTQSFIGDEASETNFRQYINDFDILHLAMHAVINDSLPSFSRLAFTQDTSTNLISDGFINTLDIYNLNINASLTVLSACNTGSGQLKKGEGIMSLARGFFYAGCPSIIMSLWEVEDQSGSQMMSSFYKNLKKGKTKDEALRLAKLEYLKKSNSRRSHPHYWLGYISLGDNAPLYKSYDYYFFIFLIILVVGIFADQVYRIKKARKKRAF